MDNTIILKANQGGKTVATLQTLVKDLEKKIAFVMGPETETIRATCGDRMANEVILSTCALLCARSLVVLHVWTGEPIDAIRNRLTECIGDDIKPTLDKMVEQLGKGKKS